MTARMKLTMRPYRDEEDFWTIRRFLREVYLQNGRTEHSWQAARLDYWRWHGILNMGDGDLETGVFLWETPGGDLAAVANCEGLGFAFLQVDPRRRTAALEEEMVSVAEERLTGIGNSTERPFVCVSAQDSDTMRTKFLTRRGYTRRAEWHVVERKRDLSLPIPDAPAPEGYVVRAMRADDEDLAKRSWASWRAFHPDEPNEKYEGWTWYRNIQRAPMYRRDLDLVAETSAGEIASFATLWYDDVTRAVTFEPVGTVPEHQRHGLAKAVIAEGMRRAKGMGALVVTVGGGGESNPPADALYAGMFAKDGESVTRWLKYLDGKGA
jgi:mycothiol synthase